MESMWKGTWKKNRQLLTHNCRLKTLLTPLKWLLDHLERQRIAGSSRAVAEAPWMSNICWTSVKCLMHHLERKSIAGSLCNVNAFGHLERQMITGPAWTSNDCWTTLTWLVDHLERQMIAGPPWTSKWLINLNVKWPAWTSNELRFITKEIMKRSTTEILKRKLNDKNDTNEMVRVNATKIWRAPIYHVLYVQSKIVWRRRRDETKVRSHTL